MTFFSKHFMANSHLPTQHLRIINGEGYHMLLQHLGCVTHLEKSTICAEAHDWLEMLYWQERENIRTHPPSLIVLFNFALLGSCLWIAVATSRFELGNLRSQGNTNKHILTYFLMLVYRKNKWMHQHVTSVPESSLDFTSKRTPWLTNMAVKDYNSQHCSCSHWPKF